MNSNFRKAMHVFSCSNMVYILLHKFLISIIRLTLNHEKLGPNVRMLQQDLKAAYAYGNAFAVGVVYGAAQFYKEFQKKNIENS